MCSATQVGLRRRRSKEETREARVARSATGPGKPYWKSPAGSTGGARTVVVDKTAGTGIAALVVEVEVVDMVVLVAMACC